MAGRSGRPVVHASRWRSAAGDRGATLWCGATGPGRRHDTPALRVEGIAALLQHCPQVTALVDAGYRGLARDPPGRVPAPPLKLRPGAPPARQTAWEASRKA